MAIAGVVGLGGCEARDDAWRDRCAESPARLAECVQQDPDVGAWASWAERRAARQEAELTARIEGRIAAGVRAHEAAGELIERAGRTGERLQDALSLCRNARLRPQLKVQCDRMYGALVARRASEIEPMPRRGEAVHELCDDIGEVRRLVREGREEALARLCREPWSVR